MLSRQNSAQYINNDIIFTSKYKIVKMALQFYCIKSKDPTEEPQLYLTLYFRYV